MGSAEEELQRRRERGRLAQSAFRKRQSQIKQDTKAENDKLKNAIAEIVHQSRRGDGPGLREKIRRAAVIAGLEADLDPSPSDSTVSPQHEPQLRTPTGSQDDLATTISSNPRNTRLPAVYPTSDLIIHRDPFHCYKCTEGALTILPFLGAGAFTFAGRIMWHLIEKHEALVHAQDTFVEYQQRKSRIRDKILRAPVKPRPQMAFKDLLSMAPSVQQSGSDTWISLIEERMEYYRDRSTHTAAPMSGDGGAGPLHLPAVDSRADEALTQQWLSPVAAEKRVREIVGDDVFALLAQPVVDRAERERQNQGHAQPKSTELIDLFLDMLADSCVCHGNGPRWDARAFDELFRGWLSSVTGGQLQPVNQTM